LAQSNRFDYVAEERVSAAYIMGDFDIGRYVSVLGGVRYEDFRFDNRAPYVNQTLYDGQGDVRDTLSVERSMGQWFPNAQIRIKPTDWFDVRLAYTRTTSRPDYQFLLPNTWVDSGERGQAGNPNLRPTMSENLDAFFSIHTNKIGLFTFGLFRKTLSDVIRPISIQRQTLENFEGTFWAPVDAGYVACSDGVVRTSCEDLNADGNPDGKLISDINPVGMIDTYVNNPYDGHISGFEVDWQTNFWYLPRPLNSLVLNVNYTRLSSEMDYQSIQFVDLTPQNPFDQLTQVDTFRVSQLYQQADDIINIAVGLDIRGFSGRISFRYQGEILATLDQRNPADDAFTQPVYSWDFSLRQRLPLPGLSLFFNGVNISHPANYNNRTLVIGPDATGVSQARTQIAYWPRRFQVGIRYGL
ncbi:MAG TPA: TonB-dependent receptor, partial [Rhodothermales bacterium]